MESWLPWLTAEERLLPDLVPDEALVLLCEPRRMRDRAQSCSTKRPRSPACWRRHGAPPIRRAKTRNGWPVVAARSNASWRTHAPAPRTSCSRPRTRHAASAATAFDPVVGDADALSQRLRRLTTDGLPGRARGRRRRISRAARPGACRRRRGVDAVVGGAPGLAWRHRGDRCAARPRRRRAGRAPRARGGGRPDGPPPRPPAPPRRPARRRSVRGAERGRLRRAPDARRRPVRGDGQPLHRWRRA